MIEGLKEKKGDRLETEGRIIERGRRIDNEEVAMSHPPTICRAVWLREKEKLRERKEKRDNEIERDTERKRVRSSRVPSIYTQLQQTKSTNGWVEASSLISLPLSLSSLNR